MESPQRRESFKIVEIAGNRYRIGKFDALTGSYFIYSIVLPMLPSLVTLMRSLQQPKDGAAPTMPPVSDVAPAVMEAGKKMSKAEFVAFQRDCLSVCQLIKNTTGVDVPVAVMLETGSFGVPELEHDIPTVMALTVHAIMFNAQSFFVEGGTENPLQNFMDLSLFSPKA